MVQYHVTLAGQGFMLDLDRYQRRVATQFAPKRSSGARGLGDFLVEDGLRISDWSGGEGYPQLDPDQTSRYRSGSGIDYFTEPGSLRLGPAATSTATLPANEILCLCGYAGVLFAGLSNGDIYYWNGSTWTLSLSTGKAGGVTALEVFTGVLYASNGTDGAVASFNGAWTNPRFTVAGVSGIWSMRTFYRQTAQYLYLGCGGAPNAGGSVYWWDGGAVSAKQYDFEQRHPHVAEVLANRLYWVVSDPTNAKFGIYSVDDSGSGGVYRNHVLFTGGQGRAGVVYNGKLYFGDASGGRIYSWDGTDLVIEQLLGTAASAYAAEIRGMVVWNGALWIGIVDGGTLGLLRFDGASWSRPATGLSGTQPRAMAVWGGNLYLGTSQSGAARMHYFSGATFAASGTVETGLFDAGLPGTDKVLRSVTILHSALASGQSIQVQYQLEGTGSWTTLGTSSTLGATTATFAFSGTVTCKQVAFRVNLAGSAGASSSPVLYDLLLRYRVAPTPKREWELPILLEGTPELPLVTLDGTAEPLTGPQLSSALWTTKAQAGTVTFVDIDGLSRQVWFEDLREEIAQVSQRRGYQLRGIARLVEA